MRIELNLTVHVQLFIFHFNRIAGKTYRALNEIFLHAAFALIREKEWPPEALETPRRLPDGRLGS